MNPHYTLRPFSNIGGKWTEITLTAYADRPRATALFHALQAGPGKLFDMTPVRAEKWAALYDAGWNYDDRGFYCAEEGSRWVLSDAMKILRDREVLCSR